MKVCGIDLGTTNSLIGHGDELYTNLVSSSVDIYEKKQVTRDTIGENIVSSYKTDMTTGTSGQVPIECSAIILRELADRATRRIGESVTDVVISVPAKFSNTQRAAVYKAAEKAGLTVRGLINEPTAAAIYVCKDMKELIMVFDLGGGTFDVTILDSRAGNYFVVATGGEGKLAGDNFDKALAKRALDDMKVKFRFKTPEAIKRLNADMRIAKESLQKTRSSQYVDMSRFGCSSDWELTEEIYVKTMKEVFEPTLTITKKIMNANLMETEIPKMVFVGGSTACPYLREWILEETGLECIECDEQPDYIVAKGVAAYAKMVQEGTASKEVSDVTKCLAIEDECGMADVIIEKNTTIPVTEVKTFCNTETTRYLNINLYQGDSIVCRENEYIGTLVYDYGSERKVGTGFVEIEVTVNRDGIIKLQCSDMSTGATQDINLVMK